MAPLSLKCQPTSEDIKLHIIVTYGVMSCGSVRRKDVVKEGCRKAVLVVWEEGCRKAVLGAWEKGCRKAVLGVWEEGCRKAVLGLSLGGRMS